MTLTNLKSNLQKLANPKKAIILQRFFKTGKGGYGEGDKFLGLTVPQQRKIAKIYSDLSMTDLQNLLNSKIHEYRLVALLIMINQYKNKANRIYRMYMANTKRINNWDLVDLSAPNIVGNYLKDSGQARMTTLLKLAKSKLLWDRRIAVLATFTFIRNNDFKNAIKIAEILLNDKEDLMHKAVGWMLREIGKRDVKILENFLQKNISKMPRTMLRYAIEKFPEKKRKCYLNK